MSREVSCDLVGGSNHSGVLDTLKSRYPCAHEPLPAAATATPDDRRYLTSLWVFEDREVDEPESPLPPSFSNLMVDQSIIDPHMIKEKITSVLKVLKFREQHVLVQFWSPVTVQKRWLLTTWDQPFGLGWADEELYSYRKKSERFAVVADEEHTEKLGSPGRVYSHKLPEWSLDVQGQDTSNNVHGYINLPVFESSSDSCVGVLEIITSSSYVDFAFEVQEVSRALKNQNLKSPNVFEDPSLSIADERRRRELDEIFKVLKTVCDIHNLPLAQTWAPCGYSSYVANSENLEQSCSSFNRNCIGKVCISTVDLPFYVRDLNLWEFREVCRERHLDKSQGVVGRSLSSCGAWFCEDVTKLDEDDYPLVHIAHSSGLNSCLAIYLKSPESDAEHVIEFFLPAHSANETGLRRLMETFKQQIKNSSWMQLDIVSPPQVLGGVPFNWDFESPPSPLNLLTEKGEAPPPESENMENEPSNSAAGGTSQNKIEDFDIDSGKISRKRKRSDRMISYEEIKKLFGKTMDEAAAILNVSRSTLKRICRNHGIPRWPYKTGPYKSDADTFMKSDQTDVAVFTSEGTHTPPPVFGGGSNEPFGGTTYITQDPAVLTENAKHSSTHVPHQKELANVTFKATYRDDTIKFTYRLLDGLVKLEEEVATRFHLTIGSFRLRYKDEDGDMITIACDNDLKALGAFMQLTSTNMIKLSVQMVAVHSSSA
ncbi:putative transcription factor Nin-like family [Helianthus annuus]|uniref:Putative PB1 domain, RWP-RK domain protein n=1 Tax=Helianthus annuus TaxID=4232 RepID=A0A251U362_HELAN|nr:protein NLP7 [Helianthus annuus]KAF5753804.1 putative transcription factor Nin-like family [Helianthus annuus]